MIHKILIHTYTEHNEQNRVQTFVWPTEHTHCERAELLFLCVSLNIFRLMGRMDRMNDFEANGTPTLTEMRTELVKVPCLCVRQPMTLSPTSIFHCLFYSSSQFHFFFGHFLPSLRRFMYHNGYVYLTMIPSGSSSSSAYTFSISLSAYMVFAIFTHLDSVYSSSLLGFVANLFTYCVLAFVFRTTSKDDEEKKII